MARKPRRDVQMQSLLEQIDADPRAAVEMAAADTALNVSVLLRLASEQTALSRREIAEHLGVGEARLSQIVNGDGNVRVSTLAKALKAFGYRLGITAFQESTEKPLKPSSPRKHRNTYVTSRETYSEWSQTFVSGVGVTRVIMSVPEGDEAHRAIPIGQPVHHATYALTSTPGLYSSKEHRHDWAAV